MQSTNLVASLEEALGEVPLLDPHTHLDAGHLSARGLHDVLLYHMVVTDLYAAGCPSGARLSDEPDGAEAERRLAEAMPFLPDVANTSCTWGLRILLRDLYGWDEPLSAGNWRRAHAIIRERSADPAWPREVLRRAGIRRAGTLLSNRADGQADDVLQYSLEWAFFARCQWGEFDTALYELERTREQDGPTAPTPIGAGRRPAVRWPIRSAGDVRAAVAHYCDLIPFDRLLATAQHISTDIDYSPVSDAQMDPAIRRRDHAGAAERDVYASFVLEAFLSDLERRGEKIVFQFSLGAEPLPFETGARLSQRTIAQLAEILQRHPRLQFQCFDASRHANQSLCSLARELPNLSLAGYWWHNFFPDAMRQIMNERLDMLPLNKQIGFFSDAYCVEWSYAKSVLVRKQLARVLAAKVEQGQYSIDDAVGIARAICFESPRRLLRMTSAES